MLSKTQVMQLRKKQKMEVRKNNGVDCICNYWLYGNRTWQLSD